MKKFLRFISYILVALIASGCTLYWVSVNTTPIIVSGSTSSDSQNSGLSKLAELINLIDTKFIGEYDETKMYDAAADAIVDSLGDRWSYYISAEDYADYEESMANSYVGIGVTLQVDKEENTMMITKVNPGSPAEEAGLLPGDYITKANGKSTAELGIDKTKNEVRGEEGTFVEITILRGDEELVFQVERRTIDTVVASCQMLENNIGLVTITNFDSRCAEETLAAIDQLLSQGAKAIVFDVRNNPGGYKNELVKILDYLLPKGDLFRSVDYTGKEQTDTSDASYLDIPMAVLINDDSYSAAEFFAAALSEYEAAFTVGTKTCGKGYFQITTRLSDGSAVGLSVGKYYTPKGVSLAGVGITPDYEIEVDEDTYLKIYSGTLAPEEDPQIQKAVEVLKSENNLDN